MSDRHSKRLDSLLALGIVGMVVAVGMIPAFIIGSRIVWGEWPW